MHNTPFTHEAIHLEGKRKLVYTAFSKHYFYFRMYISQHVLAAHKVPINPFMLFDYFLLDTIDRDTVRDANNSVLLRSDEMWVFGPISNGVLAEILLAHKAHIPISYFKIDKSITPLSTEHLELEEEVERFRSLLVSCQT